MPEMKKQKILFVTSRLPYPLIGGDRVKSYFLLKHLAKHHDVTLVSFFQGKWNPQFETELQNLGLKTRIIKINPIQYSFRVLFRLKTQLPLEILYYMQPEMQNIIDEEITNNKYDLAIGFFMRTAEYLKNIDIPKLLIAEDCRSLYQYRSYKDSKDFYQKFIRRTEFTKLLKYEPVIFTYFDKVTFVTKEDIKAVGNITKNKLNLSLLSNGTDLDKFKPDIKFIDRSYILFTGRLDLWSNVIMLRRIVNNIMPSIWAKYPDIKLRIVGGFPVAEVKAYNSNPRIELIANVQDIAPHYFGARLFIHPHLGGTGIQNKLLEAMSSECPVVTTITGNHGIYGVDGQDLLLADTDEEFVEKSLLLLQDSVLAERIGKSARKLITETHTWEIIFSDLDRILDEVVNQKQIIS